MDLRKPICAVVVGGYIAPGINGVITAFSLEAIKQGCKVFGFDEGFRWLAEGTSQVRPLDMTRIQGNFDRGGSIVTTSEKQLRSPQEVNNCLRELEQRRVRHLVTIGGIKTAYSAYLIEAAAKEANISLSVVHVPKTIFNDLPLPEDVRTFGFDTARLPYDDCG